MSENKKRSMTSKWFLSLAARSGLKSAEAFIDAHREWLETGELADSVAPILVKLDAKEIYPTPGLDAIMKITLDHIMASDVAKAESQVNKSSEPKTDKPYTAVIMTASGKIATDNNGKNIQASFVFSQDADRWCQRRLNDGAPDWHGEVTWNGLLTNGKPMVMIINRTNAIKALAPKNRTPFMHRNKVGGGNRFGNRMSVSQTHVNFSRG